MPPTTTQPQQGDVPHSSATRAKKKKTKPPSAYAIAPISAFYIFLLANTASALFAPIQDCDETFNYWEPAHYLSHGYGLQTWEYSPDHAIRSWSYILPHALVGSIRRLLPRSSKVAEFYFVRHALALLCSLCQVLLFRVVSFTLNSRVGLFFLIATVTSPGNFHAATAFLPSSFTMYTSLLGASAFMNWRGGLKTSWGIWWFALGGILGWPFAAALSAPFLVEEGLFALMSDRDGFFDAILRFSRAIIAALLLVAADTAINTFFYKDVTVVAWNIVKYNIFSRSGGPSLYGTEPWTFYFRNLAINFNIWFVLALLALPLFLVQKAVSSRQYGFQSGLRTIVFLTPFYLWLAIFTLQPHKEERFMYPAYPFLCLNAALALHIALNAFGKADPKTLLGRIPAGLKFLAVLTLLIASLALGASRILGVCTAYSAPLKLYTALGAAAPGHQGVGHHGDFVCFGKEWYRFPSSYFLPRDMHAKFVRSEFRGLLPGEFSEARTGFGFWSGAHMPTSGMNDRNEEDYGKYTDVKHCSFMVDTQYPLGKDPLPPREPDYISDTDRWTVVKCEPFMDAARTPFLARVLWVPDWPIIPDRLKRKWGRHCLLQKK